MYRLDIKNCEYTFNFLLTDWNYLRISIYLYKLNIDVISEKYIKCFSHIIIEIYLVIGSAYIK